MFSYRYTDKPSDKVIRFLANEQQPPPLGEGFWIHIAEEGDRLRILVEFLDNATDVQMKNALPVIREWRQRLDNWQGKQKTDESRFLDALWDRHYKEGDTFRAIAKDLNQKIMDFLQVAEKASRDYQKMINLPIWETEDWHKEVRGYLYAKDILRFIRANNDEDLENTVQLILEEIKRGEIMLPDEYPVSPERVRATLKSWRKS